MFHNYICASHKRISEATEFIHPTTHHLTGPTNPAFDGLRIDAHTLEAGLALEPETPDLSMMPAHPIRLDCHSHSPHLLHFPRSWSSFMVCCI